ncbi:DUF2125 domain-containing protein [Thalassobius sp. Cn5-15]|uniref:DUF2125 domain-containing protein n=1 Tax=Thalassobius sp. Cn5-15 TaxID=2917763 RepID=UPI001EF35C43|nr:DUF2125 domain-containing protein [Thalassobius sp. Cn5-15]MCG7495155.1 DUF2125 domain-containing protein [Thalassobius sp. Cn5-15]
MKRTLARSSTAIAALLIGAPAAFADVTPKDVWANWMQQMQANDLTVSATETMQGNDLKISDLKMTGEVPEIEDQPASNVEITMPGLELIDNGDGTVDIKMPNSFPMNIAFEDGEDSGNVVINYNSAGLKTTASGEPEAVQYDTSAASIEIALDKLVSEEGELDIGTVKATLINVKGNTLSMGTMLLKSEQTMTAEQMLITVDAMAPEGQADDYVKLNGSLRNVTIGGSSAIPKDVDYEDMSAAMKNGFAIEAEFSHAGSEMDFDMLMDQGTLVGNQSSASGEFTMSFDAETFRLGTKSSDAKATAKSDDLPFPVSYSMGETLFDLVVPLAMDDAEQNVKLAVTLADFTMDDALWNLFDRDAQLQRDPATVSFDITGKVKVLADLFDKETLTEDVAPGELSEVTLNNLTVRAAGAELTGAGAFTFDNSDLVTFGGMPRPEGAIDLALTGANKLLDTLVAMNLVGQDDVMGARMMMGMFAVPGEGEDSLKSTIEVNSEGHVLANGMRLQ